MIVKDILENKVIGLFQNKMEWGPRALGNRSIIAIQHLVLLRRVCFSMEKNTWGHGNMDNPVATCLELLRKWWDSRVEN